MDISDYYHQAYRSDLALFMDGSTLPYFGHSWRLDCGGLDRVPVARRAFFLVCLYFSVLVDQALHEHYPAQYPGFEELTRCPKFCRGLSQFQHNPRGILSVPIERGLVIADELHEQLAPGMELFVSETVSFFRDHMPEISPVEFFKRLANDPGVQIPLLIAMLDKAVAESTDFLAFSALLKAINDAGLEEGV